MSSHRYWIPAQTHRIETMVLNSRFIATIVFAESVSAAKESIANIRVEMSNASHHVYAFRIGYGNSVTEGASDDGEPSGTAGPPVLAVLRGRDIGDTLIVVTRYFGGTKLGTGGLVRAYSHAARSALETLELKEKIAREVLGVEAPYPLYELIKRIIARHNGIIEDETFTGDVTIIARFPVDDIEAFTDELSETSAGRIQPVILGEG